MLRPLAVVIAALVWSTARTADADETYRGEMAIVDGTSVALFAGGLLLRSGAEDESWRRRTGTTLAVAGALGVSLGAGIVHASHDEGRRAGLSIGMRFLAPGAVTAGFLGYYLGCISVDVKRRKSGEAGTECLNEKVALTAIGLTLVAGVAVDYALSGPRDTTSTRMLSFVGRF